MNWLFILLIFGIPLAVWILSTVFRSQEQPRGDAQRNPEGPQRPRLQSSDIDRFLEEINRRRRNAPEHPAAPPVEVQMSPPPAPPRISRTDVPPRRQPPAAPRPPRPKPVRRVPEAVQPAAAASAPPVLMALPAPHPSPTATPNVPPVVDRPAVSPALAQFASMVRSPQSLMAGLVLQEILGPPLCYRKRRFP